MAVVSNVFSAFLFLFLNLNFFGEILSVLSRDHRWMKFDISMEFVRNFSSVFPFCGMPMEQVMEIDKWKNNKIQKNF
jgi:hypothetical protein